MRKKVLIIAYYFPPMGGSGVQRPSKMAKYLREFGWEPVILAPEPGAYISFDESLLRELQELDIQIERVKPNTPFHKSGVKKKEVSASPAKEKIVKWLTSWFFLPDNKKGWIEPAVVKAVELHNSSAFDSIVATAPPYSNSLVASALKKIIDVPILLDFRDDWLKSHWIWYPTKWHYRKMRRIEHDTLSYADAISVVNPKYKTSFGSRLPDKQVSIHVIPNGFDPEDFLKATPAGSESRFKLLHSGRFYNVIQPDTLLKSVNIAIGKVPDLQNHLSLEFQGGLDQRHWSLINKLNLEKVVTDFGYVEHKQAVQNITNADLLYLTLGERPHMDAVTPGKLFEYMGSGKPVLAHIPEGITAETLSKYGAATTIAINDAEAGATAVLYYYELWKRNNLPNGNERFVSQFSRLRIAEQFAEILNHISDEK